MKVMILALAMGALVSLTSCQKCTSSSSCTGSATQTSLDTNINNNAAYSLLGDTYKKAACDVYTAFQTSYGSGCTIAWK